MKFDIQHAAAVQTVRATERSMLTVDDELTSASGQTDQLIGALGQSPTVSAAVQAVRGEVFAPTGEAIRGCTTTATSSTATALSIYSSGDQQMAQHAQSQAGAVAPIDMPGVR